MKNEKQKKSHYVESREILPRSWTPFDLHSQVFFRVNLSLEIETCLCTIVLSSASLLFNLPLYNLFLTVFQLIALHFYHIMSSPQLINCNVIVIEYESGVPLSWTISKRDHFSLFV